MCEQFKMKFLESQLPAWFRDILVRNLLLHYSYSSFLELAIVYLFCFRQISDESLEALTSDLSSNKTMNFNFKVSHVLWYRPKHSRAFKIVFKRPMKGEESTSHSLDLSYPLDTSMRSELLSAVIAGEKVHFTHICHKFTIITIFKLFLSSRQIIHYQCFFEVSFIFICDETNNVVT